MYIHPYKHTYLSTLTPPNKIVGKERLLTPKDQYFPSLPYGIL